MPGTLYMFTWWLYRSWLGFLTELGVSWLWLTLDGLSWYNLEIYFCSIGLIHSSTSQSGQVLRAMAEEQG